MNKPTPAELAIVLEHLGFKAEQLTIPFKDEGHKKVAYIKAKDLYEIIDVLDWDELQDEL